MGEDGDVDLVEVGGGEESSRPSGLGVAVEADHEHPITRMPAD
jgi:hypothetical protein